MDSLNTKPLIYYFYVNGSWEQKELPVEISEMRIGNNPELCEIQMDSASADEIQVQLKRVGTVWYFFESGNNPMMKVNGIPRRQAQLLPKSSLVIQIGGFLFIFSTRSDKILLHKTAGFKEKLRPPKVGEFSLKGDDQEISYPQNTLCIIGSNPLCEFHIHTKQPFCGYINFYKNNYHFTSLIKNYEIMVSKNGLNVNKRVIMEPGSKLVLDTDKIVFNTPGIVDSEEFNILPNTNMALIQIDDKGEITKIYKLPESGSSIYAGRSQERSHIVIEGSTKISRQHAQIVVFDNYIQLVDIGATNGLFVNDERITNVYVNPGDLFRMADLTFFLGFA